MALDFTSEVRAALVALGLTPDALRGIVREETRAALAEQGEGWSDNTAAAKHTDRTPEAWGMFYRRHPDLMARASIGADRNRRWKLSAIDAWMAERHGGDR